MVDVKYWRVTYYINFSTGDGGSAVDSIPVKYGTRLDTVTMPGSPTRPGYTFAGWDWNGYEAGLGAPPDTMPAESIVATATWTPNPATPFRTLYWVQNANDDN